MLVKSGERESVCVLRGVIGARQKARLVLKPSQSVFVIYGEDVQPVWYLGGRFLRCSLADPRETNKTQADVADWLEDKKTWAGPRETLARNFFKVEHSIENRF